MGMMTENRLFQNKIVKSWEMDTEVSAYKWALYYLKDRKISPFIFEKPSSLMGDRVEFLINQVCAKNRKWIICFSDSVTYIRKLYAYVAATFVLSTNLNAEIKSPRELVEFAFGKQSFLQAADELSIQTCSLLMFPCFEATYPGYLKARPKIIELLLDRKIQKKPFIFSLHSEKLPKNKEDIPKFSASLADFFGKPARDLFSDNETKFVILRGE